MEQRSTPIDELAVPFDDRSSCGVRVERSGPGRRFVTVQVVTRRGEDDPHDLTQVQAGQLRDALAELLDEPSA
jgi:membrane-bound lytic murein transglycosylase MltF